MKLLTKNTDYAIRALIRMAADPGRFVPSQEIAEKEGIPLPFLRTILRKLARERLLETREGAAGGARLAADPREIRVSDLIRLFQGTICLSKCMFRRKLCGNRSNCVLRRRLLEIERTVADRFDTITVAGLLDDLKGDHAHDHPH